MASKEVVKHNTIKVAQLSAAGLSQREIAREMQMTQQNVSVLLSKKEAREIIDRQTSELLREVPQAVKALKADLRMDAELSEWLADPTQECQIARSLGDIDSILKFKQLAEKKSSKLLQAIGVFPSNQTNYFVQNIHNDNRTAVFSPEVLKVLGSLLSEPSDEEITDAEIIEGNE